MAASIPGDPGDNHKALFSLVFLIAAAFIASGIAGHSPQAGKIVVLFLIAVTFLLSLATGVGDNTKTDNTIMQYPWIPGQTGSDKSK